MRTNAPVDITTLIGEALRDRYIEAGFKRLSDFADACKISRCHVCNIVQGHRQPSFTYALRMNEVLRKREAAQHAKSH